MSINFCGNFYAPFVGFLSKKEPQPGTRIERGGNGRSFTVSVIESTLAAHRIPRSPSAWPGRLTLDGKGCVSWKYPYVLNSSIKEWCDTRWKTKQRALGIIIGSFFSEWSKLAAEACDRPVNFLCHWVLVHFIIHYFIISLQLRMSSGAYVTFSANPYGSSSYSNVAVHVPPIDFRHTVGMCGVFDGSQGTDQQKPNGQNVGGRGTPAFTESWR